MQNQPLLTSGSEDIPVQKEKKRPGSFNFNKMKSNPLMKKYSTISSIDQPTSFQKQSTMTPANELSNTKVIKE